MHVVSFYNDKGGVGKTSLTILVGTAMAVSGKRVLLVDNDPQYSLSSRTALDKGLIKEGLDFYYGGKKDIFDILKPAHVENLFLAPAGFTLSDYYMRTDKKISDKVDKMFDYFRTNVRFTELFDYVFIDNPPTQNGITMRCNLLSDAIVIPVIPDETCYEALVRSYMLVQEQADDFANKLIAIVPSLVNVNRKQHNDVLEKICDNYLKRNNNTVIAPVIKNRSEIPDSIGYKNNIFVTHAASEVAQSLIELCTTIFPWIDKEEFKKSIRKYADDIRKERGRATVKMIKERSEKELKNA